MSDPDFLRKVRALEALNDRDFASAVYKYVRDANRSPEQTALFRDPDLITRTLQAVETLIATTEAGIDKMAHGSDPDVASKIRFRKHLLSTLQIERRAIKGAAHEEAEQRAQLRRGKGPRHRAMVRLSKMYPKEFLTLVREEQAKDDQRDLIDG